MFLLHVGCFEPNVNDPQDILPNLTIIDKINKLPSTTMNWYYEGEKNTRRGVKLC